MKINSKTILSTVKVLSEMDGSIGEIIKEIEGDSSLNSLEAILMVEETIAQTIFGANAYKTGGKYGNLVPKSVNESQIKEKIGQRGIFEALYFAIVQLKELMEIYGEQTSISGSIYGLEDNISSIDSTISGKDNEMMQEIEEDFFKPEDNFEIKESSGGILEVETVIDDVKIEREYKKEQENVAKYIERYLNRNFSKYKGKEIKEVADIDSAGKVTITKISKKPVKEVLMETLFKEYMINVDTLKKDYNQITSGFADFVGKQSRVKSTAKLLAIAKSVMKDYKAVSNEMFLEFLHAGQGSLGGKGLENNLRFKPFVTKRNNRVYLSMVVRQYGKIKYSRAFEYGAKFTPRRQSRSGKKNNFKKIYKDSFVGRVYSWIEAKEKLGIWKGYKTKRGKNDTDEKLRLKTAFGITKKLLAEGLHASFEVDGRYQKEKPEGLGMIEYMARDMMLKIKRIYMRQTREKDKHIKPKNIKSQILRVKQLLKDAETVRVAFLEVIGLLKFIEKERKNIDVKKVINKPTMKAEMLYASRNVAKYLRNMNITSADKKELNKKEIAFIRGSRNYSKFTSNFADLGNYFKLLDKKYNKGK